MTCQNEHVAFALAGVAWAYDLHSPDALRAGTVYATNAVCGFRCDGDSGDKGGFCFPVQMISAVTKQLRRGNELLLVSVLLKDFR